MLSALWTSFCAALLELDNVQAGQFLLARPAFVGTLLGWMNGCPVEGARIGLLTELVFLDFMSVGGVVPPNGLVSAAVSVLAFSWGGLPESAAFFSGMLAGLIYCGVEYRLRAFRSSWTAAVEAEVRAGVIRPGRRLAAALLAEGAVSWAFIFLFSGWLASAAALSARLNMGPLFGALDLAYSLMPWLGLSGLYFRFRGQIHKNKAGA
ncbi:MAG TPA: PTS sugar transporter subunit IIC [Elusimicrobiales bacterium]|nr:PTS sugar transporter subunit IIC [Elusimicrobiales bacterium]